MRGGGAPGQASSTPEWISAQGTRDSAAAATATTAHGADAAGSEGGAGERPDIAARTQQLAVLNPYREAIPV